MARESQLYPSLPNYAISDVTWAAYNRPGGNIYTKEMLSSLESWLLNIYQCLTDDDISLWF